jgi:hypothetical protein
VDFAPSFPDHRTIKARIASWREMADAHPWITDDVLRRAVYLVRWQHKGGFVPEPATFLDYCHAAVGGFDGRAGTAPLRARRGLQPLTEAEVAAAHQRRGREG